MIHLLYIYILKPILFLFDPEYIHNTFINIGKFLWKYNFGKKITNHLFYYSNDKYLSQDILWMHFENPVWLSAGFDKHIQLCNIIRDVWFGFEEVWSITKNPYDGNPKPRLHRIPDSKWLIVNYWLKNDWVHQSIQNYKKFDHFELPIWISIAKTNCAETCDSQVWLEDYIYSLTSLSSENIGDAYVLNISCPNARWWENFASPNMLDMLLQKANETKTTKPIFIKMPIDKTREETKDLLDICLKYKSTKWVIISNLIKDRSNITEKDKIKDKIWWISWLPTQQKSTELIWKTYQYCGDKMIIVWVGGIFDANDAYQKIRQWATLVQLITGMIYEWPQLIWNINKWLVKLLQKDWYNNISQAIWANYK